MQCVVFVMKQVLYVTVHYLDGRTGHCTSSYEVLWFTLQFIILMAVLVIAQAAVEFCVLCYSSSFWWWHCTGHCTSCCGILCFALQFIILMAELELLRSFVFYVTLHHLHGRTGHCTSCCGVLCFMLQFIILMGNTGYNISCCGILCFVLHSSSFWWLYWSLHKLLWAVCSWLRILWWVSMQRTSCPVVLLPF